MHFCTAEILLGGDDRNVMTRTEFNPVSWPEVEVLQVVHGSDSVRNVRPFVSVPQTPRAERDRLANIYGGEPLAVRWGGLNPPQEMEAPRVKIALETVWYNPITYRTERIGSDARSRGYTVPAFVPPTRTQMLGLPDDEAELVGDAEFLKDPAAAIAARQRQRDAESEYYVDEPEQPQQPDEPELELVAAEPAKAPKKR